MRGHGHRLRRASVTQPARQYNTGVGAYVLHQNVSGQYNTAMGDSALYEQHRPREHGARATAPCTATPPARKTRPSVLCARHTTARAVTTPLPVREALFNNTADGSQHRGRISKRSLATQPPPSIPRSVTGRSFNNTASGNTATGDQALLTNSSGTENTATGVGALFSNSSGNNNTATGYEALFQQLCRRQQHRQRLSGPPENSTGGQVTLRLGLKRWQTTTAPKHRLG